MADDEADPAVRAGRGDVAALEVLYPCYVQKVWDYTWLRTYSQHSVANSIAWGSTRAASNRPFQRHFQMASFRIFFVCVDLLFL